MDSSHLRMFEFALAFRRLGNLTCRPALDGQVMAGRPFAAPWDIEDNGVCFIVRDNNGQALLYVYYETEPGRRTA
jgi:hypothetical protein